VGFHLFGVVAEDCDWMLLALNFMEQAFAGEYFGDFRVASWPFYLFGHFEQIVHVFFLLVKIEEHLLSCHYASEWGYKQIDLDSLDDFQHVLEEVNFNIVALHSFFGSFTKSVLIFVAETENSHFFIDCSLVG
jgi:hypothetical protein